MMEKPGGELILYEAPDGDIRVDVRFDHETVWLSLAQISELFGRDKSVISRHLGSIFSSGELERTSAVAKNATTAADGKTYQVEYFNLDAILSVGYRVNSKGGTHFRIWATRVLREQLVQGYSFNRARLAERGLDEARQVLDLLARTLHNQSLVDDTGKAVLDVILAYADTWRLLLEYDEGKLALPVSRHDKSGILDISKARTAIRDFKKELGMRNEAGDLFGSERGEALDGILGSIEQTMFGEPLYRSTEEKAANLLYLIIKDHPFSDGNKRIGSFLFMLYLHQEKIAHRLNPQALTALALLVAESAPPDKDLLVRLIANLITEQPR